MVLVFAAALVSFQSFAQTRGPSYNPGQGQGQGHHGQGNGPQGPQGPIPGQGGTYQPYPLPGQGSSYSSSRIIQQIVRMNVRSYDRLDLAQLLRLSYQEESSLQLLSLTITAQSMMGSSSLQLSDRGRILDSEIISRQLSTVRMQIPMSALAGLELSASGDLFIDSIAAEVSDYGQSPYPGQYEQQVQPNQLLTLRVGQMVRGYAAIDLDQLARQQMGLSLLGAEIQRVVVQGRPAMYGRSASVQVQLNQRLASEVKFLSQAQDQLPLPIQSLEAVRDLDLIVNGDAEILEIRIRVGNVRPQGPQGPQYPMPSQRIYVGQEVSYRMPLELSRLLGYQSQLIRSITIEARSMRQVQAQLSLLSSYGEVQGVIMVRGSSIRGTVQLRRPMSAQELRLEAMDSVWIEALEIEFENYKY